MPFHSIKTYGAERGLSCVFRQWDARTDCQLMHGYLHGQAGVAPARFA